MRDPDLMQQAERAAATLEEAWMRWRARHGFGTGQAPPVSSYVGYSLEEPWGQPRVVFGLEATEAERLATIIDGGEFAWPFQNGSRDVPEHRRADVAPGSWTVPANPAVPPQAFGSGSRSGSAASAPARIELPPAARVSWSASAQPVAAQPLAAPVAQNQVAAAPAAPAEAGPAPSAPDQSAPDQSASAQPAPAQPAPVESAPVEPAMVKPAAVKRAAAKTSEPDQPSEPVQPPAAAKAPAPRPQPAAPQRRSSWPGTPKRSRSQPQPAKPARENRAAPSAEAAKLAPPDSDVDEGRPAESPAEQPILPRALREAAAIADVQPELPDHEAAYLQELAARPGIVALQPRSAQSAGSTAMSASSAPSPWPAVGPSQPPASIGRSAPYLTPQAALLRQPGGEAPGSNGLPVTRLVPVSRLSRPRKQAEPVQWPAVGGSTSTSTDTAV